jgi:hypothetical protein
MTRDHVPSAGVSVSASGRLPGSGGGSPRAGNRGQTAVQGKEHLTLVAMCPGRDDDVPAHHRHDVGAVGDPGRPARRPECLIWIPSAYTLVVASLVLSAGTLGNLLGRKRMFCVGVVVMIAGGLLATTAGTTATVIAAQLVAGLGGALILPNSLAILGTTFTDPLALPSGRASRGPDAAALSKEPDRPRRRAARVCRRGQVDGTTTERLGQPIGAVSSWGSFPAHTPLARRAHHKAQIRKIITSQSRTQRDGWRDTGEAPLTLFRYPSASGRPQLTVLSPRNRPEQSSPEARWRTSMQVREATVDGGHTGSRSHEQRIESVQAKLMIRQDKMNVSAGQRLAQVGQVGLEPTADGL